MNTKRATRVTKQTVTHTPTVPVVENLPMQMYLRREIATGTAPDGTAVQVSTTGPHLIIDLGQFPHGRQFVINISDLTVAVLEQLTAPGTAAHGETEGGA